MDPRVAIVISSLDTHDGFYLSFPAVSGVGSSPALATCETSQVLLAGMSGGFSRGTPVFAHLLSGPSNLERDVKLN